jgi:dihydroxy-acid dehydratase
MSQEDFNASESSMIRSKGHCNTMGTASTMGCIAEALGMTLPGLAGTPAADSRLLQASHDSGRRIVEMVKEDLKPQDILTFAAFTNAIVALGAIGGSTNAVVHLLAIAGRVGVPLSLDDFDRLGKDVPVIANMMPSGKFLMEEFFDAGGVPTVMKEIANLIHTDHITVTGKTVKENIEGAENWNKEVITPANKPFQAAGAGIVVVRGSLAPDGAIIKVSAASPKLLTHKGKALVFKEIEEYLKVADDPNLPVTPDTILVLQNSGPKGYPGFPEVGNMPMPKKMLDLGITDMVRISDARMSGTAYGTVVLHVSPESTAGGPLAFVQDGDEIELDVPNRKLNLLVSDEEMAKRKAAWVAPKPKADRGWSKMYIEHVQQAHLGADLDFLVGSSGDYVPRHSH